MQTIFKKLILVVLLAVVGLFGFAGVAYSQSVDMPGVVAAPTLHYEPASQQGLEYISTKELDSRLNTLKLNQEIQYSKYDLLLIKIGNWTNNLYDTNKYAKYLLDHPWTPFKAALVIDAVILAAFYGAGLLARVGVQAVKQFAIRGLVNASFNLFGKLLDDMTSGQTPTFGRYAMSFGINFVGGGFFNGINPKSIWGVLGRVGGLVITSVADQRYIDGQISVIQTVFALFSAYTGFILDVKMAKFVKLPYVVSQIAGAKITQSIDLLGSVTKTLWKKIKKAI